MGENTTAKHFGGSAVLQLSNLFTGVKIEHIDSSTAGSKTKERFLQAIK
jgi:hypothetical protein